MLTATAAVFALILLGEIYLSAATASIGETYQPGINTVRVPLIPELWILVVVGMPLLFSVIPRLRGTASRTAFVFASAALASALLAFPVLALIDSFMPCDSASPAERTLESTLRHSLFCPQLSNRSYAAPFYTSLLAGTLVWLSYLRKPEDGKPAT